MDPAVEERGIVVRERADVRDAVRVARDRAGQLHPWASHERLSGQRETEKDEQERKESSSHRRESYIGGAPAELPATIFKEEECLTIRRQAGGHPRRRSAGDVVHLGKSVTLEKTRADARAIAAGANHCRWPVVIECRCFSRELVERNIHGAASMTICIFAGATNVDDL